LALLLLLSISFNVVQYSYEHHVDRTILQRENV
jgi:hypothetical protein